MDESLLGLLPTYGLPVLGLIVGLGCFGVPLPSSLAILLAGSFAAVGDFSATSVFAVCLAGALIADNLGFLLGRYGGAVLSRRFAGTLDKAHAFLSARGGLAVFFSRWLVSPLGPAINLVAGAAAMPWRQFILFDLAGEAVWVTLYMAIGAAFSSTILGVADILANATAAIAFAVLAVFLGLALWRRRERRGVHRAA